MPKTKPVATLIIKETGKRIKPEEYLPMVFKQVRSNDKVYKDMETVLPAQLLDDILFSKITANFKELYKQHGEPFKVAYDAYKHGKGAKNRKDMAKHIKTEISKEKQKDLNKRIDQLLNSNKIANLNPQPDNPYMMYHEGEWIDNSPKALAERIRDERDKAVAEAKDKEAKKAFRDIAEFTLRLQKENQKLMKPLNQLRKSTEPLRKAIEPAIKVKSLLTGKPMTVDHKYPFINPFGFNFGKGLGLLGNINKNTPPTILGSSIHTTKIPRVKPEGSKRRAITGTGITSYMERHGLTNPVDIAKTYLTKKGKDYEISGFSNIRFICEQMNVSAEEAFLYICEGMRDSKARWRHHRMDKEFWRGSQSVVNLVIYFNEQVAISKKNKNRLTFTVKMLHGSSYCKELFAEYGVELPDYTQFSKWFKKMRHHVDVLKLDKPKKTN